MTREQKLATFAELSKRDGIKTGREFAESFNKARILIDHPHSYREWEIVGPASERGFYRLQSSISVGRDFYTERMTYTRFELVLFETDFQRIQ
jgi:hypothetical protein